MRGRGERRLGLQEAGGYEKAPTEVGALHSLVARTRFELVISALRGRRPKPLDERAICLAGRAALAQVDILREPLCPRKPQCQET